MARLRRFKRNRIEFVLTLGLVLFALLVFAGCGLRENPERSKNVSVPTLARTINGPVNYVALGDSTGAGVGAKEGGYVVRLFKRILAVRPASKLTNFCFSGATTEDVLHDQVAPAVRSNPNLITVGIGINDVGHGFRIEDFAQNYDRILARLTSETNAILVVTNIPDISMAPQLPRAVRGEYHQRIVDFNQKLSEIASRHGVIVFDIYSITHEQLPSHPEFFSEDGFHPSDKGYESWAEQMWPTVARVIGAQNKE